MASATVVKTIGQGVGSYDYASLHAACMDLKAHPLTDDCIWKICTNLTETVNTGIMNNTEHSLTITVDAAEDRVVTFETPADNDGPSGNFVIGGEPMADQASNIPFDGKTAKNITVDGSFEGDGVRHLSLLCDGVGGVVVVFYGDVTNSAVKNCIIKQTRTSGTTYALHVRTEKNSDRHPVAALVENCYLEVTGVANAQVIYLNSSQRSTTAGLVENTTIKDCEIVSNLRGIFFNGAMNANFEGCTFRLANASPGYIAHGIMGNAQSGTINVKGCKFLELKTNNASAGAYGIHGITASGGADVWNIENNIFTGLDALNASVDGAKAIEMSAVRCGDACNVIHNTFVMPELSNHPTTALTAASPITLLHLAGASTYLVQNNIFVGHETTSNVSLIRGTLSDESTGNRFYHDGGNAYITAGAATSQTWADFETNSSVIAPTSAWKEVEFNADMSLAEASIGDYDLAVAKLPEVDKDINGVDRLDPTYAGAEAPGILLDKIYAIGNFQDGGTWNPAAGVELTKVAGNVYKFELNVTADTYLAFLTELNADWDIANTHRYACGENDKVLADGSVEPLVKNSNAIKVTELGKHIFTLDFNTMQISVVKIKAENLYVYSDVAQDWGTTLTAVPVQKVADNIFEGTYSLPYEKHILFAYADVDNWTDLNAAQVRINSGGDYWLNGDSEAGILTEGSNTACFWNKAGGVYTFHIDLNTNKITITQLSAYVDVTAAGYATYYNSAKAYEMPAGLTGYVFNVPGGLGNVAYAANEAVEAGRALVLAGNEGTYELIFVDNVAPKELASMLHGSDAEAPTSSLVVGDHLFYGLSLGAAPYNTPEYVGFYWMAENGAAFTNGAHKAFLAIPVVNNFLAPAILFNENGATNIENLEGNEKVVKFIENGRVLIQKNGVVYDAMGRVVR